MHCIIFAQVLRCSCLWRIFENFQSVTRMRNSESETLLEFLKVAEIHFESSPKAFVEATCFLIVLLT